MIAFLIDQITGGLWPYLVAAGAALAGLVGVYFKGRSDAAHKAKTKAMQADLKAHERITDAPTLRDATDAERAEWLRAYNERHGNK